MAKAQADIATPTAKLKAYPAGSRKLFLVCVLLLLACSLREPESSPPETSPTLAGSAPVKALPRFVDPQPPEAERARAIWTTATTAYALGHHAKAAEDFLKVATVLNRMGSRDMTFSTARCLAYRNAVSAWARAGELALRRKQILDTAKRDPACQHTLRDALKRLQAGPHK